VMGWSLVFLLTVLAFSSSITVLYRNHRSIVVDDDDCYKIEKEVGSSTTQTFLFMLRGSLEGSDQWTCFHQSSAQAPGLFLYGAFLLFVVVVLLNMLIAMMAETFTTVFAHSFKQYAVSFGAVLVAQRINTTVVPPLNLLSLPYHLISNVVALGSSIYQSRTANFAKSISARRSMHDVGCRAHGSGKQPSEGSAATMSDDAQELPPLHSQQALLSATTVKLSHFPEDSAIQQINAISQVKWAAVETRNPSVVRKFDEIRLEVIEEAGRKQHFERSVNRFCAITDDTEEPLSADETRDLMREVLSDMGKQMMREVLMEVGMTAGGGPPIRRPESDSSGDRRDEPPVSAQERSDRLKQIQDQALDLEKHHKMNLPSMHMPSVHIPHHHHHPVQACGSTRGNDDFAGGASGAHHPKESQQGAHELNATSQTWPDVQAWEKMGRKIMEVAHVPKVNAPKGLRLPFVPYRLDRLPTLPFNQGRMSERRPGGKGPYIPSRHPDVRDL